MEKPAQRPSPRQEKRLGRRNEIWHDADKETGKRERVPKCQHRLKLHTFTG